MSSKSLWFTVALEFVFLAAAAVSAGQSAAVRPPAPARAQTPIQPGDNQKGVGLANADGLRAGVFVRCGARTAGTS